MLDFLFWEDWNPVKLEHEFPATKEHVLKELYHVYEVLGPEATVTFEGSEPEKRESGVLLWEEPALKNFDLA